MAILMVVSFAVMLAFASKLAVYLSNAIGGDASIWFLPMVILSLWLIAEAVGYAEKRFITPSPCRGMPTSFDHKIYWLTLLCVFAYLLAELLELFIDAPFILLMVFSLMVIPLSVYMFLRRYR